MIEHPNAHVPPGPVINTQGGALQLGMKAQYLPGISQHVTLTSEDGLVVLQVPLAGFDWVQPDAVLAVTLGFVQVTVAGAGPKAVQKGSGLILPTKN